VVNDFIVTTKPENDLFQLLMQRVRWASKTSGYQSSYAKFLAIIVLLVNLSLVCGLWLLQLENTSYSFSNKISC